MLRSQLRGVKQRPDHLRHARPTEPSLRRTTAPMRRSKPGASLVRRKRWQICSGPPCGCPHARTAPSPFSGTGWWFPDGVRPGSDPIFRFRTCSIALGRRPVRAAEARKSTISRN